MEVDIKNKHYKNTKSDYALYLSIISFHNVHFNALTALLSNRKHIQIRD